MKLLVLDGNSILNRAFYGIKLLTTKSGEFTNGIVGFLNILEKVKDETEPDAVAIAFDMKAPTFRHKAYAGYKAQRKGMPPELAAQMPVLKELLGDLGECAGGVAVCLGTAIDQKNLHHKLPLLSVTSAEDYRTRGQMAWARCETACVSHRAPQR